MQNLKFKSTFVEETESLMKDIQIVLSACSEVLDNPKLKEFLVDIVLAFGTTAFALDVVPVVFPVCVVNPVPGCVVGTCAVPLMTLQ